MSALDLYLDDATVQELTEAADRNLAAPTYEDNPTFKPGKKDGLGTWSELYVVRDTALDAPKNGAQDGSEMVFKLVLEVLGSKEGGFDKNAGKTQYLNVYIERPVLLNKSAEGHQMAARRIGTINSLLAAVGVPTTGGVKYGDWFNGKDKPLVGQKAIGITRKYQYTSKKGPNAGEEVTQTDIDGFLSAAAISG
jgi:hypothetical protein